MTSLLLYSVCLPLLSSHLTCDIVLAAELAHASTSDGGNCTTGRLSKILEARRKHCSLRIVKCAEGIVEEIVSTERLSICDKTGVRASSIIVEGSTIRNMQPRHLGT